MRLSACLLPALLFACSPAAAETTAVRVNGLGFAPDAPKRAIVETDATEPLGWVVRDATGRTLLSGRTVPYGQDAASGHNLHRIDFGALTVSGGGLQVVADGVSSPPFTIAPHLYEPVARDALAYFYHNRAGTPIRADLVGEQLARPAGHLPERATCVQGRDTNGNEWAPCSYTLDVTGGWYDAGDHGKYVVNGGIATWTLLNLHETLAPFADNTLKVPEAGNGVPDLLDEARWEVEFLLRMQVPDGQKMRLAVDQPSPAAGLTFSEVDAGGMAHHKVGDISWAPVPLRPDQNRLERVLAPPSTAATLNLAAVALQCARVWQSADPAFAARCAKAATRAIAAAERNPAIYAVADFPGSGAYGDGSLTDEFFWAQAELYATTRDPRHEAALRQAPFLNQPAGEAGWGSVATLGLVTLAQSDTPLRDQARQQIVAAAHAWVQEQAETGFAIPHAGTRFVWGSNSGLLNRAMLLALAAQWTGEARYRTAVVDTLDYLLGRNPNGRSYISGYGTDPMRAPHHRHWAGALDPAYPLPPAGALSGGPNSTSTGEGTAGVVAAGCAPMRCWADDVGAYALNEVAINWNAPLAWVVTWLDRTQ
ncbi:glycoside hydrolase family 9 protein [Croceibacterium ferulae]|uniref:glycoside hydrolase family 9 protein n=1 Tax=Croceibacterium ferulae TaxID=1854641 RepID=UPI000EAC857D|nr:glycoside hydrolase family 9 protein [Croceibacterium ferulae]